MAITAGRTETDQSYFADDADYAEELARLRKLERLRDPTTIRYLEDLGIHAGSWCLEVGPGAGSIARWMAKRVGPKGKVVAADIDPRFLTDVTISNLEVRRHDIARNHIETAAFDYVHARLVLMHIPDPVRALRRMIDALRPGGWLLLEDADLRAVQVVSEDHPYAAVFGKVMQATRRYLETTHTFDASFGRRLPKLFERAGLVDIDNEVTMRVTTGGEGRLRPPFGRYREAILATGEVTAAEWETRERCFDDPTFSWMGLPIVATWGRKL